MNTPFLNATHKLSENKTRFFVPGHKGNSNALPFFNHFIKYDITEVEGADDLTNPNSTLAESQHNMAKAYGSGATLYSASGSSSCIQAMITLFAGKDNTLVIARNCHISAVRAIAFLNITPEWVPITSKVPTPHSIEIALQKSCAKAVYITSPDYYGHLADIKGISAVCKKYGASLLVDNAHGAYLHFLPHSLHPLFLGADCTCDSAHKTLPTLTPAALLHLKDPSFAHKARQTLNLYSSTSPSYLVLQSLDYLAGLLLDNKINFTNTLQQVENFKKQYIHLIYQNDEPLKICLCPPKAGWKTEVITNALLEHNILPEFTDENYIVLMASPYNTADDFNSLAKVLLPFTQKSPLDIVDSNFTIPTQTISIRDALFGNTETVTIANSVGRICASLAIPCPPGMPIALPGETITQNIAKKYAQGGIFSLDVLK